MKIRIRASAAYEWSRCTRKQLDRYMRQELYDQPKAEGMPVGMAIGNAVHAAITDHQYTTPTAISYDRNTGSEPAMRRAITSAIRRWNKMAESAGFDVYDSEIAMEAEVKAGDTTLVVSGHTDLVTTDDNDRLAQIELKTGAYLPHGAMLQSAVCAWLWRTTKTEPLDSAGVVWIPRDVMANVMRMDRNAALMADAGEAFIRRMARELSSDMEPSATPGDHCFRCNVQSCMLRSTALLANAYGDDG